MCVCVRARARLCVCIRVGLGDFGGLRVGSIDSDRLAHGLCQEAAEMLRQSVGKEVREYSVRTVCVPCEYPVSTA